MFCDYTYREMETDVTRKRRNYRTWFQAVELLRQEKFPDKEYAEERKITRIGNITTRFFHIILPGGSLLDEKFPENNTA